ncbi:unnamed protein product [Aphanomyces euteiches]
MFSQIEAIVSTKNVRRVHFTICSAMSKTMSKTVSKTDKKISSLLCVQESKWIIGKFFKERIWTLQQRTLTITTDDRFKFIFVSIKQGCAWPGVRFGIQVETTDGKWLRAMTPTKAQWAMWLQAFQDLSAPQDVSTSPVKVRFCDQVKVHRIPTFEEDDDNESLTATSSDEDDIYVFA